MSLLCSVALDNATFHFDKLYDYTVPDSLAGVVKVGCRVFVPFGRGNAGRQGVVLAVFEGDNSGKKPVTSVLDREPLLSEEFVGLVKWLKERTFSTYYDVVKTILPPGLNLKTKKFYTANTSVDFNSLDTEQQHIYSYIAQSGQPVAGEKVLCNFCLSSSSSVLSDMVNLGALIKSEGAVKSLGDKTEQWVRLTVTDEELLTIKLTDKQKDVVSVLQLTGEACVKEIQYFCGVSASVISAVVNKGIAEYFDSEIYRDPYAGVTENPVRKPIELSPLQTSAYQTLSDTYDTGKGQTALLYGVTGSGKTQVYLKLVDKVIDQGKSVIVMVPEISLSTQTLKIFHQRYGKKVAVFHSRLSMGERADEWKRVKRGEAQIVVGTRSAVFAPFDNLGLVIIDEEQEHTYKSEQSPRYSTSDVAKYRCAYHKSLLVLSSATPSVESYTLAKAGKYVLATIPERYGKGGLPQVITADLRKEVDTSSHSSLGATLRQELINTFEKGEQSILLINRRGYNTFVSCNSCGSVVTCPHCSISMTYHRSNGRLMCHYCGYSTSTDIECSECHGKDMRFSGSGTQRIEQEVAELLPRARLLRMDMDTTMAKNSHENMLNAFSKGEYDILLGTQMVAKGLDFPAVTLVGVVNADASLYNYDYRCAENSFDLITQVVGRAGRASKQGKAIIQTVTPDSPIIELASKQDYDGFYSSEIGIRRLMTYPPYCDICTLGFVSSNEGYALAAAQNFLTSLVSLNEKEYKDQKFIVLGPSTALVSKVNNKYRFRIMIKCKNSKGFRDMLSSAIHQHYANSKFKYVSLWVDMNPRDSF